MKKALSVLCLLGLLLSSCVTAFAGTDAGTDAEGILTSYLNAIVNQNVEEILTFVIDERYSSNDCDFQKEEYTHFLKEKKLIDYKITNMSQESPTLINFETILTSDNGSIEKVPFVLRHDKSWKVIINEKSLEKNYKVIQEGTQEPEVNMSSSVTAFAGMDAEGILTSYLNAIVNQNVEEILTFVIDERYSSNDCDFQKEEYTHFLKEKKLIDYKITNMFQESPTLINFETILTSDNGSIEKVPFVLRHDKSWKVIINEKSLEKNYKVIQEGTQEPEANTSSSSQTISPLATTLVSWSFSGRSGGAIFYSIGTFNIDGSTATLANLTQSHDYVSLGYPVGITYAVVKKGIWGDSMWGQKKVSGEVTSPTNYSISGSGSYTGAQIRFTTDTCIQTNSLGYRGTGSLTK